MGIRQKLNLAIGVLAALTLVSNAIGGLFFGRVQDSYAGITTTNLPAVITALNLATMSAELAAGAPVLANAVSSAEREKALNELKAKQQTLAQSVETMKAAAGEANAEAIGEIEKSVQLLNTMVAQINRSVTARLNYHDDRETMQTKLAADYIAFQALMKPALERGLAELGKPNAKPETATAAHALISAGDAVNQLVATLSIVAQAPNNAELDKLFAQFVKLNSTALEQIEVAGKQFNVEELKNSINVMLAYGQGTDSVFGTRRGEIRTITT
ncbi:MAG: hypothetical protein VW600_11705, partial [Ferrovibrio sp.]